MKTVVFITYSIESLHSIISELRSSKKSLAQELDTLILTRDKNGDSLWYYLEDMFGEILVALYLSRVEIPLEINDVVSSEWLGILDIVLSTQVEYLKLLNLELKILPLTPSSLSTDYLNELTLFASSFSIVKRY
jgi:hypothetical protein